MKYLYIIALISVFCVSSAQEAGRFRFGIDPYYAIPQQGSGYGFALEPKYNIADDMNVGLRLSYGLFDQPSFTYFDEFSFTTYTDDFHSDVFSIVGTFDYYFDDLTGNALTPFAGAGIQYSAISNDYQENSGVGGFVRLGLEYGKFRFAADYNVVPASPAGIVSIKNDYIGIGVGVFIGGGKW